MNYAKLQNIIQEGLWSIFESTDDQVLDGNISRRQRNKALDSYGLLPEYVLWKFGNPDDDEEDEE